MNDNGSGTLARNRRLMDGYLPTHDTKYMSEDVVVRIMASGQEYKGRAEVDAMFAYFYGGGAFDARADMRSATVGEDSAAAEADLIGTHTGEFAGVPATRCGGLCPTVGPLRHP